jgi:hypothetical protein
MKVLLLALLLAVIVAAAALLPVRPYLDFQVIYHADLGLLRGIPLYNHAGQVRMVARLANVSPEQVFVLPFPYPPWYALATLWLAMLPIGMAVRAWFGVSLLLFAVSVWLLSVNWRGLRRFPVFVFALLWLPVLGSLFVGQYGFPVLLGAALMIHALERHDVPLTAAAAVLLTFKPHLGAVILILAAVYLWLQRDAFGRRALLALAAAAAALAALGFLASPMWPLDYFHSLTDFKDVSQCHQCVSVSMAIAGAAGRGLQAAVWISAGTAMLLCVWLVHDWRRISSSSASLVTAGVLATLLASPYLQNYDYLLLLVPLIVLSREATRTDWIWIAAAFALPLLSLALLGTVGNVSLVFSALILFAYMAVSHRWSPYPGSAGA